MSSTNQGAEFLAVRFPGLAGSPEISQAADRTQRLTGESVPRDSEARIQNYLARFREIVDRDDPDAKARGIAALKTVLVSRFVVRVEDIPEGYWQAQLRIVRERGQSGDWQVLSDAKVLKIKQEYLAQLREDQKGSIEEWIDYLASEKSSYLPDHLKYWVFAGMLRLERYEKAERDLRGGAVKAGRFPKRPSGKQHSVKMFPELNESGLKFIAQAYKRLASNQDIYWGHNREIPVEARPSMLDALSTQDFRAAYEWVQEYIPPITEEELQIVEGEACGWVTFSKKMNHTGNDIATTLAGKGTGWCIAGTQIAQRNYLDKGAIVHIYFTRDRNGKQANPRVVIVELQGKVSEVGGIDWDENVDGYITASNVIGLKLQELPTGDKFFETDADAKQLTAINHKVSQKQPLSKAELAFLYELDRPIKTFGLTRDPRIEEIRSCRDFEQDMPAVFGCESSQIARTARELRADTRIYIGPFFPEIFSLLYYRKVDYSYLSFPEKKIRRLDIAIGGKSKQQLLLELEKAGVKIDSYVQAMFRRAEFTTLSKEQVINLVILSISDLELPFTSDYRLIFNKANQLGLDLCPAEVGPELGLLFANQKNPVNFRVGMKPLVDTAGRPEVFHINRLGYSPWVMNGQESDPGFRLDRDQYFIFTIRKRSSLSALLTRFKDSIAGVQLAPF